MGYESVVDQQIKDAIAAGAFDNLPGAGQPLRWSEAEQLAGDNWLGYKVLQNGGMVPEWLGLAREIEVDLGRLEGLDRQHEQICALAVVDGGWEREAGALRHVTKKFEELARSIRKRQDRWNISAPGIRSQRPGLWVEYHLERLRQRIAAAGGPA
jgi:hypothetical protein